MLWPDHTPMIYMCAGHVPGHDWGHAGAPVTRTLQDAQGGNVITIHLMCSGRWAKPVMGATHGMGHSCAPAYTY